ncbi:MULTISPECIES: hypothetical protein [Acinetobacter]|uniref:hypothetical protein n=1 Tax=Acinetobacter TaxID=469 RepID=UPI00132F504C|nr:MULTISPECIES: hypothetical protein [Acinetobacter]MCP0912147.1 hypothetical protein [Acinetobacter pseudolwoffii]MDM1340792.1 hypothetical protein [Acinetobacter pseudolwoffii]NLZ86439.1 hypothetical protein [Gammaproteobacteria bacterium]
MTQIKDLFKFRKNYLAMTIGLILLPSAHAMQELSDSSLSDTTGEGVALVLDDFKMVFQGPKDISAGSSYARGIENPGQADTGFIRIIPTGENYEKLGERLYDKVYSNTYHNAYLAERARIYNHVYGDTYASSRDAYITDNRTRVASEITAEYAASYRGSLVQQYLDSPIMKQYYDQRYADYYNGSSAGLNFVNDGTTKESITPWLTDRSKAAALKNTLEMIELLYGNNYAANLPNSPFYQSFKQQFPSYVRANVIKNTVDSQLAAKTTEMLNQLAADYAKEQATTASNTVHDEVVRNAINMAKAAAQNANIGSLRTKADVFIYGLALSKSDDSLSTRYSNQGFSWGSADNPWLFRAGTESVKQFKDAAKDVGYIALEAPLAKIAPDESDNNIKLGFWSDIFARELNSSNVVDPITGGPTSGLDTNYRLRTQFVANGLSLNGSQVRLFQTLESDNKDYNQTLGMASIVRLNTNDRPETLSSSDSNLNSKGIRLSTAAKTDALDGNVPTPALNGSAAPIFHDSEGLYLYSPNINLVLGNMYQPFVVGSEGNNIILEVTRIPNIPAIYNQIYQNYGGGLGESDLKGSTCNVYSCGTPIKNNASDATVLYQGRNATHSSISIGTTERIPGTNLLRAKDGPNSTGVVFKSTDGISKNFGSAVIDGVLIQHLKIRTTGL